MYDLCRKLANRSTSIRRILHNTFFYLELLMLYAYGKDKFLLKMINEVRKECDLYVNAREAFLICSLAKSQYNIKGDMAEVGVYKGGTAKLICEFKGEKNLHLFDTFIGLPQPHLYDQKYFHTGMFKGDLSQVQKSLKDYSNVFIYSGDFLKTHNMVSERKFSFVHLDVDLYETMFFCLNFFYHRMVSGGIILAHDYQCPGIKRAFLEFFQHHAECPIELDTRQCIVIRM